MTVQQLSLDALFGDEPAAVARPAPVSPATAAVSVNVRGVLEAIVDLIPGFACDQAPICGSVAPGWSPGRAINAAPRGIGLQLVCEACWSLQAPVIRKLVLPPARMIRRESVTPAYGWDPETGELVALADPWVEVDRWGPELEARERWAHHGRLVTQPRVMLSRSGTQRWVA